MARRDSLLTRGALAVEAGCNIETIRYYEQIGLLPPPRRSEGGHRLYDQGLVKRLHFVRRGRELGFSLDEIRAMLRLVDGGGDTTCAQIEALARAHVHDIAGKIADLRRMRTVLETLASQCASGTTPECPIVDALFEGRARPTSRSAPLR